MKRCGSVLCGVTAYLWTVALWSEPMHPLGVHGNSTQKGCGGCSCKMAGLTTALQTSTNKQKKSFKHKETLIRKISSAREDS